MESIRKAHIGIDIGKIGAIVVQSNGIITRDKMPMVQTELDYQELYNFLAIFKDRECHVVFEKLGVIFGTSKGTAFSMGHQAGAVEMACVALQLPFTKVPPKTWQKDMFVGISKILKTSKSGKSTVRDTKAMALLAAKQLFPKVPLAFKEGNKAHDGLVDALLMSEYSRKHF